MKLIFLIAKDKENKDGTQINYLCRCLFLEIYNGEIGDLLDPTQTNLEINDDTENEFYINKLTEECLTSYEDVTKMLIKPQGASSKWFGRSKTTRLSLIDLDGFESNMLDDGALELCLKDGNLVKKSTSQLGNLIDALVKHSHLEISQGMPFGSSCLTHLLKKSFGGNSKLSIICTIIRDKRLIKKGCFGLDLTPPPLYQNVQTCHSNPSKLKERAEEVKHLSHDVMNTHQLKFKRFSRYVPKEIGNIHLCNRCKSNRRIRANSK